MTLLKAVDRTAHDDRDGADRDLATMLAEMDGRMRALQQELATTGLPIARHAPRARAVARRRRAQAAAEEHRDGAMPHDEGVPDASVPAPSRAVPTRSAVAATIACDTIREADQEARQLVEDTLRRIAEIGLRTRALLEHALAEPGVGPEPAGGARRRARTAALARHAYEGVVTVGLGPVARLAQVSEFELALESIFGIEEARLVSFREGRAAFELRLGRPTLLVVELQARWGDTLDVVAAGDTELHLEIVSDTRPEAPAKASRGDAPRVRRDPG